MEKNEWELYIFLNEFSKKIRKKVCEAASSQ